jgi:MFS family permease
MSSTVRDRALSLAAGALPAAAIWWFVRDPMLAASVGFSVLVAALLWSRVSRRYGERFADETWQDRKWTSLLTGVVSLAAFNGTLLLPLSLEYRIGVQALVLGCTLVGYTVGTLTEIERDLPREHSGDRPGGDAVGADD